MIWQNLSALSEPLLVLLTNALTISVKNTYSVWGTWQRSTLQIAIIPLTGYVYLSTPMGPFKIKCALYNKTVKCKNSLAF